MATLLFSVLWRITFSLCKETYTQTHERTTHWYMSTGARSTNWYDSNDGGAWMQHLLFLCSKKLISHYEGTPRKKTHDVGLLNRSLFIIKWRFFRAEATLPYSLLWKIAILLWIETYFLILRALPYSQSIQIDLCVMCVFVLYSPVSLSPLL